MLVPAQETALRIDGNTVRLRASLGTLARLVKINPDLDDLLNKVSQGHFGTIREIIRAAATRTDDAEAVIIASACKPLAQWLLPARAACLQLWEAMFEADDTAQEQPKANIHPMTTQEIVASYYKLGICLEWSPATIWAASIAEINAAASARSEMNAHQNNQRAPDKAHNDSVNNYSQEQLDQIHAEGRDPAFDRKGLRELQAMFG